MESRFTSLELPVAGMSCAACAVNIENTLRIQKGIKEATVNYAGNSAQLEYDASLTSPEALKTAIQSIGYDLLIDQVEGKNLAEEFRQKHEQELKIKTIWAVSLAVPVVILGMFFMHVPYVNWIMMALTLPVVAWSGQGFFVNAFKQGRHGKANMDTLVAMSTGIAFLFSAFNTMVPEFWTNRGLEAHVYFEAAAVVVAFILLGKWLEEKAKSNTTSAIKKLMGLQPATALVLQLDGHAVELPIAQLKRGDKILVRPGDKIPVDGEVLAGNSFVDESSITGDPLATEKSPGSQVFSGTLNQKGSLEFIARKVGSETLLAQIIRMVKQAQGSKAPVQKMVDKIAGIFVPVVIGIALLSFLVWMIFGGEHAITHALLAAVTVLVIACPCALGLATPTAIMVGVGKGAENGILIKDAQSLEQAHLVNAIILDKTGTLTEGKPEVVQLRWLEGLEPTDDLKSILYSIERRSEHPLAEAVIASLKNAANVPVDDFLSYSGRGVSAKVNSQRYFVGSSTLMMENHIMGCADLDALASQWEADAQTVIWFSDSRKVLAAVAITDKLKATSANAVASMQAQGIEVHMLTGDNEATARATATKAGITDFKAGMLPSSKAEYIKQLQEEGKIVAMVGDGINDSQALAQADVSIAMGKGSDIAIDTAKMTLISSDLMLIPKALRLSLQTVRTIRQNLFWAFIYNIIGIPLAAGVLYPVNGFLLNPMIAGAAMALSSVSVVSNSLRLKRARLD
jgi:Cu2+-exporting ATPase